MILREFDPTETAIINPSEVRNPVKNMPKVAIACYAYKIIDAILDMFEYDIISFMTTSSESRPVYKIECGDKSFALILAFIGAPASAAMLEELYAMGAETVVAFGSCGVLDKALNKNTIVIPTSAVRGEGTSYHYIEPSDEVEVNSGYIDLMGNLLNKFNLEYVRGKTWTTDAFYRETEKKVNEHKEQGCICVDMECSANAAVSKFRNKKLVQFLYASDNMDSEKWDRRDNEECRLVNSVDDIIKFALELALELS